MSLGLLEIFKPIIIAMLVNESDNECAASPTIAELLPRIPTMNFIHVSKIFEIIESIVFNQLGLMDTVDLDWFQPKIDSKKNYVMEDEVVIIADNGVPVGWSLKGLPSGFRKVDQMIRMVHGKSLPVTHLVFSDGLASVSLFIEPLSKSIKPRTGHKSVGGTSFYSSVSNSYQITVVGEVPEATVAQVANAVVFKK